MRVYEIQITHPTELACEMVSTIAAQTFATCALDMEQVDQRIHEMSVNIKPRDLMSSIHTLTGILTELTDKHSQLSDMTKLRLKQLDVMLNTIYEHTNVDWQSDAWTEENEEKDEDDDD